jgi:hypothetical protein
MRIRPRTPERPHEGDRKQLADVNLVRGLEICLEFVGPWAGRAQIATPPSPHRCAPREEAPDLGRLCRR